MTTVYARMFEDLRARTKSTVPSVVVSLDKRGQLCNVGRHEGSPHICKKTTGNRKKTEVKALPHRYVSEHPDK